RQEGPFYEELFSYLHELGADHNPASYRQVGRYRPRIQMLQAFYRCVELLRQIEESISRAQLMPAQLEPHA
ncbi:MAG TPA: hypothetical protein DER41_01840, partial [Firmicutes bacterium]|nr:hypothetical protein [Bacillota bacterium]